MPSASALHRLAAVFAALALLAAPGHAHEFKAGDLTIGHPWTRATPGGARVAAGYLTLSNGGQKPDRLIGASAEGAESVELHEMTVVNDVMTMRQLKGGLEVKPGETVELKPGGYHMMMTGLKAPFKEGGMIKGTLTFENAGTVPVEFKVESLAGNESAGGHEHQGKAKTAE